MRKFCGLLLTVTLGLGFVASARAFADASAPEASASVVKKTWIHRVCEAGLTTMTKVGGKISDLHTKANFALAKSMFIPGGYVYRADAWIERQFDKLPEGVKRAFIPTMRDFEIQLNIHRIMMAPSNLVLHAVFRVSDLFKSHADRVAHNTRMIIRNILPEDSEAQPSDQVLQAFGRVLDQNFKGKFTYPLASDVYLFVKGKRLLKHFPAGTTVTVEDGLVTGWNPAAKLPPEYGVISPKIDHFLVNMLVTGYYPITDYYSQAWLLNQPGFERDYMEFLKRPAGLFEIILELLTSTPESRQSFNAREMAKETVTITGDDYHARVRLEKQIESMEKAALSAGYQSSHSVMLESPKRLFVKGKRLPKKFEAGTRVTFADWFVVDWKK